MSRLPKGMRQDRLAYSLLVWSICSRTSLRDGSDMGSEELSICCDRVCQIKRRGLVWISLLDYLHALSQQLVCVVGEILPHSLANAVGALIYEKSCR